MKRLLLTLVLGLVVLGTTAAPRSKQERKNAALQAINGERLKLRKAALDGNKVKTLKETAQYEVLGSENDGFAVVSKDDLTPAVLGYSTKHWSQGQNTNLQWWLKAIDAAVSYAVSTNTPLTTTKPDPAKYPTAVAPMVTTEWDQTEPYNRLLPLSNGGDRCYTGCVATAMAQVLNYHQTPEHGYGQRTIYYPYHQSSGTPITANFEEDYYDWDNMLDKYTGNYTNVQAQAVALLMRDCGVAADMQYGGYQENGSGAFSQDAAAGLRTYFGIAEAECLERDYYSEADWMDIVYRELSENGPLYYGGASYESGGHAFVLHGYNAQGMVYVNWGWSGDDDGYYDIALLNPGYYHFEMQQDMITGIKGAPRDLTDEVVTLTAAGTLSTELGDDMVGTVGTLKVVGDINSSDLRQIRRLAGVDERGELLKGYLKELDLSEAHFVSGGKAYLIDGAKQLTTANDELPARAFQKCRYLRTVKLPAGLKKWNEGAFAQCLMLENIEVGTPAANANFVIDDNSIVWNKQQTEIISVLPNADSELVIPQQCTALRDYALSGCSHLSSVTIPATVQTIGREAMSGCSALTMIRIGSEEPPTLGGANVFQGVSKSICMLYVPSGSETKYAKKAQYSEFGENIIAFGSAVKVRNTIRYYGQENPKFTYTVSGDPIEGTPELVCEATKDSPAGRYAITISQGTITSEDVKYIDGYMIVQKVPATATVVDVTREEGQPNPEFTLTYEGLVNDDEAPVWLTEPVFSTTADIDSPAGTYPIVVESADAESYELTFVAGTLTITEATTAITNVSANAAEGHSYHDLSGRRVAQPQHKGIYISNGKKYVVR